MCDGYGHVAWWGFSPALDLQNIRTSQRPKDELNILIIGAGDPRHIFKTMARTYRHAKTHLHFYVIDSCIEQYARHMLLLNLIMESTEDYGLQEKAELYLEIFGNTLIRGITDTYIAAKANDFIRMVTDSSYLQKKLPCVNLASMKYKELDGLEAVFKFWRNPNTDSFDIAKCWDLRVRQYLGTRYDSKEGLFDWDYHMKLREKNTGTINKAEYKKWRQTGIAFEIRDGEYTFPNATLSSIIAIKHLGETHYRRGYWGEVVTSPYIVFGIECEDKDLLKKVNEACVNSAQEISHHSVISLLYELTYGEKYKPNCQKKKEENSEENAKGVASEMSEADENSSRESTSIHIYGDAEHSTPDSGNTNVTNTGLEDTVIFLPVNSLDSMYNKSKYHHFFDVVYFSNSSTSYFSPEIQELLSHNAVVVIETITFILNIDTEFPKTLLEKMKGIAENANCELVEPVDIANDAHIMFLHRKT